MGGLSTSKPFKKVSTSLETQYKLFLHLGPIRTNTQTHKTQAFVNPHFEEIFELKKENLIPKLLLNKPIGSAANYHTVIFSKNVLTNGKNMIVFHNEGGKIIVVISHLVGY